MALKPGMAWWMTDYRGPVTDEEASDQARQRLGQMLADLGPVYLLTLGTVAIVVMLKAPKGIWGLVVDNLDWQIFPLQRRVVLPPAQNSARSHP